MKRYWLFKSEPGEFSLEDLRRSPGRRAPWDGVRNYQARNHLRDDVRRGDGVLFYHSSCKVPAVAGLAEVAKGPYPDPAAFDPESPYHDPKSREDQPTWYAVDVRFARAFDPVVDRPQLASHPDLADMLVLRRGMRLSIQAVTPAEWQAVLELAARRDHQAGG